ncbi:MAG: hypothetical protein ABFC63_08480 [Thermoguttaceae bacterium]
MHRPHAASGRRHRAALATLPAIGASPITAAVAPIALRPGATIGFRTVALARSTIGLRPSSLAAILRRRWRLTIVIVSRWPETLRTVLSELTFRAARHGAGIVPSLVCNLPLLTGVASDGDGLDRQHR